MASARHGHGMASVIQTRLHSVNQMEKTHSKPLAARHGRGTAWARHGHGMLWVNRHLLSVLSVTLHSTRLISWVRCVLVSSVLQHGFVEVSNIAEMIFGPQDRSSTIHLLFSVLLSTQILSIQHRMPTLSVPSHETHYGAQWADIDYVRRLNRVFLSLKNL
jgi:hypothetical protein